MQHRPDEEFFDLNSNTPFSWHCNQKPTSEPTRKPTAEPTKNPTTVSELFW
jgi:hypothetical protein